MHLNEKKGAKVCFDNCHCSFNARYIASTPKCILSVFEMACTVRFAKANTKQKITFYVDEVCKLVVIGMYFF